MAPQDRWASELVSSELPSTSPGEAAALGAFLALCRATGYDLNCGFLKEKILYFAITLM